MNDINTTALGHTLKLEIYITLVALVVCIVIHKFFKSKGFKSIYIVYTFLFGVFSISAIYSFSYLFDWLYFNFEYAEYKGESNTLFRVINFLGRFFYIFSYTIFFFLALTAPFFYLNKMLRKSNMKMYFLLLTGIVILRLWTLPLLYCLKLTVESDFQIELLLLVFTVTVVGWFWIISKTCLKGKETIDSITNGYSFLKRKVLSH